jgi:lipopolysaccharide/colanic/teichoic acid biosynthesis glycosyltransferase
MPVREVVLDRDIRSPFRLSPRALLSRYYLRRTASVVVLGTLDVLAVLVAAVLGPVLFGDLLGLEAYVPEAAEVAAAAAVTICVAAAQGLYGRRRSRHRVLGVVRAAFAVLLVLGLVAWLSGHDIGGLSLGLYWLLGTAAALLLRRAYDIAVATAIGKDLDTERLLVVGTAADGTRLYAAVSAADPGTRFTLAGTVAPDDLPTIDAVAERLWPSELLVADLEGARAHMGRLLQLCRRRHIPLKVSLLGLPGFETGVPGADGGAATADGGCAADAAVCFLPGFTEPLFAVKSTHAHRRHFLLKRLVDVAGSAVLLVLLSPVLLAIALAIKLTSRGPVLFVSPRVGVGQKPFPCYKFRTMCDDAEARQAELECLNEADGCIFKIAADPRVTRVGGFLRRTSLDELPQLFNVLRGHMSLVGPRPLPLRDVDLMEPWHKRRHVVLPGITGLWQVSGRSDLSSDDMLALDFQYIETWSLRGDLAIMARTAGAVLGSKGAY